MERVDVHTSDGRLLEAAVGGPADGRAVIFHTGTPSAGFVYEPLVELGAQRGLRHISYCRPGYGDSERRPGRSVADCIEDVTALADHLGLTEFFTVGWSGGGPHALACAALLPERTLAAATIAAVAPYDAAGLEFLAGMGEENLVEFAAAEQGEGPLAELLEQEGAQFAAASGAEIAAAFGDLITDVDRRALEGPFAEYMSELARGAMRNGPWGWVDDDLAFIRPWGFEVSAIARPVTLWQGDEDRMVPLAHGRWLAENVAGAKARLLDGEGHISLLTGRYGDVLDGLVGAL